MTTITITLQIAPALAAIICYFVFAIYSRNDEWWWEFLALAFGAIVFLMLTGVMALMGE